MAIRLGQKHSGFTLFEFAISAGVLAILVGLLVVRAQFYQQEAEELSAQQVASTLRLAMNLRAAKLRQHEGERGLQRLVEENPLDWLAEKPNNYLGEYYSPELEKMPTGNWVFDRRDKSLIYLLNSHKSFYFEASNFLKFKVEFTELPQQAAGLGKRPAEVSRGVVFVQVNDHALAGMSP